MSDVLYISDLDGTLLQQDGTLSNRSHALLATLLADGVLFTVASARSIGSIAPILRGLALPLPVIEFNGAFLSHLSTGEHLWINDMQQPVLGRVYEAITRHGRRPFVSTFDGRHDWVYAPPAAHAGMQCYIDACVTAGDPRLRQVDDESVALAEQVVCLNVIDRQENLAPLAAQLVTFGAAIDVTFWRNGYCPGWHWLSIHDGLATKDRAVRSLVDHAGLGNVEIVAFGDESNDIAMIRSAHRGIAVANAIAEVQAVADEIIGANTEDSVPRYIQKDWLARRH
ncbi:MAG: HAD family hydrolase [bacterium]|nr:HAD family hydrolase [bacterium]